MQIHHSHIQTLLDIINKQRQQTTTVVELLLLAVYADGQLP